MSRTSSERVVQVQFLHRVQGLKPYGCDIEYWPKTNKNFSGILLCFVSHETLLVFYSISWRTVSFTYSKSTKETPDKCVKSVQS